MFNPLINFDDYTDAQLESKILELQKKYFQTHNQDLKNQIAVSLDTFKQELQGRKSIAAQKQKEKMQENSDLDLDNLINIS